MNEQKQTGALDIFRLIAAFMVISIHTGLAESYNTQLDFFLTGVIARIAVPFFLISTGYFLFGNEDSKKISAYIKKIFLLYVIAVFIYVPVGIYAGFYSNTGIWGLIKQFVFDGTFYHLWYFPALITGVALVDFLRKRLSLRNLYILTIALYIVGLFGDSYYGLTEKLPVAAIYKAMFHIFSYTRNGLFYVPVFLTMGLLIRKDTREFRSKREFSAFTAFLLLMIIEGGILHYFGLQRHDSMYIFLLPCSFYLFRFLLSVETGQIPLFRSLSTWIYILHPMCIVMARLLAKHSSVINTLLRSSLYKYQTISIMSLAFGFIIYRINMRGSLKKQF